MSMTKTEINKCNVGSQVMVCDKNDMFICFPIFLIQVVERRTTRLIRTDGKGTVTEKNPKYADEGLSVHSMSD